MEHEPQVLLISKMRSDFADRLLSKAAEHEKELSNCRKELSNSYHELSKYSTWSLRSLVESRGWNVTKRPSGFNILSIDKDVKYRFLD